MRNEVPRRLFLSSATTALTASVLGAGLGGSAAASQEEPKPQPVDGKTICEPQRDVPVVDEADVVVCGGGPAGVAAAISAARLGAKTRLIEGNGCLGGVWTAGLVNHIIDHGNKAGIMREIVENLKKRDACVRGCDFDVEKMKLLLEEMCAEAGVRMRLHTQTTAAVKDDQGRLAAVVTESKSGREAFAGKLFVDATGDGDLAAQAGCGFDYGRPDKDEAQPMSYLVLLTGIDLESVSPFVSGMPGSNWADPKRRLAEEIQRGSGFGPSYAHPTLFYFGHGMYSLMANHEYQVDGFDADELTEATLRGRREVHRMIDGLRGLGGIWKDISICASPERLGVRESRRIHGLYQVTSDDLVRGARFDDAVCRTTFCVDVHSTNPNHSKGLGSDNIRAKPYDIPYRALIARDVKGLLLAGRCISGDFFAHASYRVTGNAVAMGEAAGAAAAMASQKGRLPQEVPWAEIQAAMSKNSSKS